MINFAKLTDFNNVETTSANAPLMPAGTIAKAIMNIRSGGYSEDPYITRSDHSGALYLHVEFVIVGGPFSRRKIFQNIGIAGVVKEGESDVFGARGRSLLRGIIESAKNISPNDTSPEAQEARKINGFGDLNGIICVVKIGIDKDKSGRYDDKNIVFAAITPDRKEYQQFIGQPESIEDFPWS
jgi:hypothetical protein